MTNVYKVIAYLNANGKKYEDEVGKFELTHENGVDNITLWNVEGLAQPTDAQLNALESDADDYEYNLGQIAKRKAEYGTLEQQMENIMENGVTAEKSRIQSIKEKYPKR